MNKTITALGVLVIILLGVGFYFLTKSSIPMVVDKGQTPPIQVADETTTKTPPATTSTTATPREDKSKEVIGKSVQGNDIVAYHYGNGSKEVLFVGGLHGGYEWNTSLVAYQLMDYLQQNPSVVPSDINVTVIPTVNPDGLKKVVGTTGRFLAADVSPSVDVQTDGRFNANTVDLNRNFDCDWKASGVWQSKTVSGGSAAFSEPESQAMKKYIESHNPKAVVVWFSAAGGVFSSNCHNGVSAETKSLTETYASASGYPANENFDFYAVTGDMTNWLAKNSIPAISVLLTNHTDTEWGKNQAGVIALLKHVAK